MCTTDIYRDGQHESSPKMKPKHVSRPLVAGCSLGQKSFVPNVNKQETKTMKYSSNKCFPVMVSVILGSSYHANMVKCSFFSVFGLVGLV